MPATDIIPRSRGQAQRANNRRLLPKHYRESSIARRFKREAAIAFLLLSAGI